MSYEYKVIPAPVRGVKLKGVKTAPERFALALQSSMNELAADGWEYLRADTLPSEQREGLMSKTTVYQNMLVFRRAKSAVAPAVTPKEPQVKAPAKAPTVNKPDETLISEKAGQPKPDKKPEVAAE